MNAIEKKIEALQAFKQSLEPRVEEIIAGRSDEYLDMQKEQLFAGQNSDGDDLRPYYSEDLRANGGYFKSPESARAYAEYKAGLSYPSSYGAALRNPDAPNLFINGHLFHDGLVLVVGNGVIRVAHRSPEGQAIMQRYGEGNFGLNPMHLDIVRQEWVLKTLLEELRKSL